MAEERVQRRVAAILAADVAGDTVPFGGMKQSRIGREKGLAALANYCEVKFVTVSL